MENFLLKKECYNIIGACMEVHNELGHGFLEHVYQGALAIELKKKDIPFIRNKQFDVCYKGISLNKKYIPDFICYDQIIVEIKTVDDLIEEHTSQVLNYLKAAKLRLGLLVNFGRVRMQHKRIIL